MGVSDLAMHVFRSRSASSAQFQSISSTWVDASPDFEFWRVSAPTCSGYSFDLIIFNTVLKQ